MHYRVCMTESRWPSYVSPRVMIVVWTGCPFTPHSLSSSLRLMTDRSRCGGWMVGLDNLMFGSLKLFCWPCRFQGMGGGHLQRPLQQCIMCHLPPQAGSHSQSVLANTDSNSHANTWPLNFTHHVSLNLGLGVEFSDNAWMGRVLYESISCCHFLFYLKAELLYWKRGVMIVGGGMGMLSLL